MYIILINKLKSILKNKYIGAFICGLFSYIVASSMLYPGHNWGGDFSQYIAQARALATGTVDLWYEKNSFIINHSCDGLGSHAYPWGFPILLTPFYILFGADIIVFKKIIIILFAASIFVLFIFYNEKMPIAETYIFTLLIGINPVYLASTDCVQSDIPCMFFSILAVYHIDRHLKLGKIQNAICAGFFTFAAVQMRTMALGILLALVCMDIFLLSDYFVHKMRGKKIFPDNIYFTYSWKKHIIPYMVFFGAQKVFDLFFVSAGETYLGYFTLDIMNIKEMVSKYIQCFQDVLGDFWILFVLFLIVGMFHCYKEEWYCVIYCTGMLVMLLIYEYYQGARFLFSIFPFIYLFVYYGVKILYSHWFSKYIRFGMFVALLLVLASYMKNLYINDWLVRRSITWEIDAYSSDAMEVYTYIDEKIDDDKVIYFFKPRVLYLNTNNYSYTKEDSVEAMVKADYWLFWSNDFLVDCKDYALKNHSDKIIFQNNQFILFENK